MTPGGGPALRFAILCERERLEPWQARCLEHLLAAEGVEPVAVILAQGAARSAEFPRSLAGSYLARARRRQLGDSIELPRGAAGLPRISIRPRPEGGKDRVLSDSDLAAVRELELDFLLSLGIDPPVGPVLDLPRHGTWAFDFDRDPAGRAGLGELRRLLRGEPVAEVALLRLTSGGERAIVLRQGWFGAADRSPSRGLARTRHESARWPAWICAALRRGESERLEGPLVAMPPRASVPGSAATLRLPAILARGRLRLAWGRLFRHPQWNIGIVDQPIHAFLEGGHPPVRWFPRSSRRGFLADPFGVVRGAEATILCEHFDYRAAKGAICRVEVSGGEFLSPPRRALELPVHMSYPFLVEDEGAVYLVPEAGRTREVSLFKADPFPRGWTKVGALVTDVSAADPTVFRHAGRWWLACTDGDTGPDENLLLWHAPRLEGPWAPHAANPVKTDVRSARPAGTPFEHEGVLYRPAQDCSSGYGGRVVINRVERLTTEEFAEEPVAAIEPSPDDPYPAGRHTLSSLGDATLVDGHRFVFVGLALLQFLRIWARAWAGRVAGVAGGNRRRGGREGGGGPSAPPPRSGS